MIRTSAVSLLLPAVLLAGSCSGATGPKGEQGEQGVQGVVGVKGPKGAKGDQGDPGEQGVSGGKGAKGPLGEQGDQGPVGAVGQAGGGAYRTRADMYCRETSAADSMVTASCDNQNDLIVAGGCKNAGADPVMFLGLSAPSGGDEPDHVAKWQCMYSTNPPTLLPDTTNTITAIVCCVPPL